GLLDRADDRRAVVAPEADQAGDIGVVQDRLFDVRLGFDRVGFVRADVDDRNIGPLKNLLDAAKTLASVLGVLVADEDHDLAAIGQGLLDQFTGLASGGNIVGADIAGAIALGGVAILADQQGMARGFIKQIGLVIGVLGADGDPIDSAGEQVLHDLL